jgi:hypothetical protein
MCTRNIIINTIIALIIVAVAYYLVDKSITNGHSDKFSSAGAAGPIMLLLLVAINIYMNWQKRDEYQLFQQEIARYKSQNGLTSEIIKNLNNEYKKIKSMRQQIKLPWMN